MYRFGRCFRRLLGLKDTMCFKSHKTRLSYIGRWRLVTLLFWAPFTNILTYNIRNFAVEIFQNAKIRLQSCAKHFV